MPFTLFLPNRAPTAEDVYARRLAASLDASIITLDAIACSADEVASEAARGAWNGLAPNARPMVASSVFPAFVALAPYFGARDCTVLFHHLPASLAGETSGTDASRARIERDGLRHIPRVIVSCAAVGRALRANGVAPPQRIFTIAPPCSPGPRAHGSAPGTATSLLAGDEFIGADAHFVLLAALASLPDLDWRLTVIVAAVADPTSIERLHETIERFELAERVSVVPSTDARCEELRLGADIFARTDAAPGYDMTIAAAFKRGIPIAVCRTGDAAPSVPGRAGASALPGDYAQLAKALRRMIFDRDLRNEMAAAAFRTGASLPGPADTARELARAGLA